MPVLTRIFAFIGALAVSSFLVGILIGLYFSSSETINLPDRIVLDFDFREPVTEKGSTDPLAVAMGDTSSTPLRTLVAAIDRAAKDDRVVGFTAKVSDASLEYAQVEEFRAALKRFRDAGKFAYAYADSFGESGSANTQYWLASGFNKIWLQPLGMIGLTGPAMSTPYAADAFKKYGITADMHTRYEYKSATDTFTKSKMPEPVRENYTKLLNDIHSEMTASIAQDRGIDPQTLAKLMDKAPILTQEAKDANLIDTIGYEDEFYKAAEWAGTAKPKITFDPEGNKISATLEQTDTAESAPLEEKTDLSTVLITASDAANAQTTDTATTGETEITAENSANVTVEDTTSENGNTGETTSQPPLPSGFPPPPPQKPAELAASTTDAAGNDKNEEEEAKQNSFVSPTFIHITDYYAGTTAEKQNTSTFNTEKDPNITALIYVDGAIVRLADESGPFGENTTADAETLVQTIDQASEDPQIKAIILRVNSPGGSVTASETIRHAIERARDKGKYILVSMGGTAASGGYWIATAADRIVADPCTITGSIGVLSGKFAIGGLAEKFGIHFDELATTKNGTMWSSAHPFTPSEMERMNAILDDIYNAFITRVAENRNLTPEQLDKLARGRVWSGKSAKEVGLVDDLGGLKEGYQLVREHLNLDEDTPLYIKIMPEPVPPLEQILNMLESLLVSLPMTGNLSTSPQLWLKQLETYLGAAPLGTLTAPRITIQ